MSNHRMTAFERVFASKAAPFRELPGPPPHLPDGNLRDYLRLGPHEFYEDCARRYGDLSVYWLFTEPHVLINDPALIGRVLEIEREPFYKDAPRAQARPVLGRSVFISNDEQWSARRSQHPFSRPDLETLLEQLQPVLRRMTREQLETMARAEQPLELYGALVDLSFALFSQAVLGEPPRAARRGWYEVQMQELDWRMRGLPVSVSPRFWLSRRLWRSDLEELMRQRRASPRARSLDILGLAVRRDNPLGERWLRDELSTIFIAGAHPVATAVCSTLVLLSRAPRVRERLEAELHDFAASHPTGASLEELKALPYLDKVVSESLRLMPPVTFFNRTVREGHEVELKGHRLPAGTSVVMSSWAAHRTLPYWKEPLLFDPDRFDTPPPPYHYFPFGIGPRTCVGRPFALACIKLILAEALPAFSFQVDPASTLRMRFFAGLTVPSEPVCTTVRRQPRAPRPYTPVRESEPPPAHP